MSRLSLIRHGIDIEYANVTLGEADEFKRMVFKLMQY